MILTELQVPLMFVVHFMGGLVVKKVFNFAPL